MSITEGNFIVWLLVDLVGLYLLVWTLDWITERMWWRYVDYRLWVLEKTLVSREWAQRPGFSRESRGIETMVALTASR